MSLPDTRWLTLTNILLGVFVLLCLLLVAIGALCDLIANVRRLRSYERELDRDMDEEFGKRPGAAGREDLLGVLPRLCACMRKARTALRARLRHTIGKGRHAHGH